MARLADHVHRLLPSLPPAEWERPAPAPASLRRDVWAGLGFLVLALFMQELVQSLSEREDAVSRAIAYLVIAGLVAPLLVRRRWPILVMLSSSAVFMLAGVGDSAIVAMQLCAQLAYFLAIYTAVAWARNRRALWTALAVVLLAMALWLVLSFFTSDLATATGRTLVEDPAGAFDPLGALPLYTFLINLLYFGGAIFLGLISWSNAYANQVVGEQAARIAAQAEELAARAVSEERLRIARELHDVIAHHISSVGVQASAARLVQDRDPQRATELLRGIESSARSAVSETRALLGVLRDPAHHTQAQAQSPELGDTRHPEPSLGQLEKLITHNAGLGLQVQLSVAEHRPGFLATLPQGLSLALYRISSEALSNVRQHSTARTARLSLRSGRDAHGDWVETETTDAGTARPGTAGSGFGLRGIRERAGLHHGQVEIGPRAERGWRTRARLRVQAPADPATGAAAAPGAVPGGGPVTDPGAGPARQ